ncbi:MAG: type II toxin-antitoxin system HicB family antitoxin [Oscillospiraceae bacterium]|nr:type II toxin-antitoxin system HicB family antitoxin [Oscillospiraceae bacterium]
MKNNMIEYKGYWTKVEFSAEDRVLYGKIEGIADLVNFECEDPGRVEEEFRQAVDDYLAFCRDLGKDPEKPYKGVFNVRVSPELHRRAAAAADSRGETLNAFVAQAISAAVDGRT